MKTFGHSGDLGDIIYAMATVKAICEKSGEQAELAFWPHPGGNTRERMNVEKAHNIGSLLMSQSYVASYRFFDAPVKVDYDFDQWRTAYDGFTNLAYSQAKFFGIDPSCADKPWMDIRPMRLTSGGRKVKVVVSRSHRYREHRFPWLDIAQKWNPIFAIGTTSELEELTFLYGVCNNIRTPTLVEMGRIISGAEIFACNQTCSRAIAEAIKHPCVLMEQWGYCSNVDFKRAGVYVGDQVNEFLSQCADDPQDDNESMEVRSISPPQPQPVTIAPRIRGVMPADNGNGHEHAEEAVEVA